MTTTAGELARSDDPDAAGRDHVAPDRSRRWIIAARETAFIAAAALLYSLVRGLADGRVDVAFANVERVISLERALGIFVEPDLQAAALRSDLVTDAANAVYIAYWPVVIGSLGWVLVRRPAHYALFRNAVLASGALSLALFALYPLAPPRFMPEHGFIDTIAERSAGYRELNASALVNEYAAMPSLHLGWVLLVSIARVTLVNHTGVRIAAATLPALMLGAIVLTGNHYIVDGIAGSLVVLAGLAIALGVQRLHTARRFRTRPGVCAWPSTHTPTQRDQSETVKRGSGTVNASSGPALWPASRRSARLRARG